MKKRIKILIQYVVFFFAHIGDSPASRRWDWENRDAPDNCAKRRRKNRDMQHIERERFLKATGRI